MNIGLLDADLLDNGTRHPNLALMKLSGYMKAQNHNVELLLDFNNLSDYDEIYISKVFTYTKLPLNLDELKNIKIGGTGFFEDGGPNLPYRIEHHMPDYNLYNKFIAKEIERGINPIRFTDYTDYSIGFATRGCFRKCSFCVNKKYDKTIRHAPIKEFLDPTRKRIYLWDDNFLSYNKWYEVLDELEGTNKYFQFRQGLDIRLMTKEKAKRISKMKYYGDFIFAFDYIKDRELIEEKLTLWKKHCSKTTKLYILCAYESQDKIDIKNIFERIKILMKYKCLPYIMRYDSYKNSEYKGMYINIARWCNQPNFFKKKSFRDFCESNQNPNSNKTCASVRYMRDFEKKHPEIAAKYFDLRFEDICEY